LISRQRGPHRLNNNGPLRNNPGHREVILECVLFELLGKAILAMRDLTRYAWQAGTPSASSENRTKKRHRSSSEDPMNMDDENVRD
jgi:hypothetical protein